MVRQAVTEFTIRPYQEGDEKAILELFPRAFFTHRNASHWQWKYADNPWGQRAITVAMSPKGELACHYAGYPVPWIDARVGPPRPLLGLQIGDTMTAPGFRGAGHGPRSLLKHTVEQFYTTFCRDRRPLDWPRTAADASSREVAWNYGFLTGNHKKFAFRFVGAHPTEPVAYRYLDLTTGGPPQARRGLGQRLAARLRRRRSADYRIEPLEAVPAADLDALFVRLAPAYGVLVERNAAWLAWRYFTCPDRDFLCLAVRHQGTLVGWSVFRLDEHRAVWGDALFDPHHPAAPQAILHGLYAHTHSSLEGIEGWFPDRPAWWGARLDALSFERRAEPHELVVSYVPFAAGEATAEILGNAYYTMGDGDLF